MAGKWSEELEKNTKQQKDLYREQYYANHGEYPPEETGCLEGLFYLISIPFTWFFKGAVWLFKWIFKGIFYMFKGLFYIFPKFLWSKGTVGRIGCGVYLFSWAVVLFVEGMGKAYIFRNWLYFALILVLIIGTASTTISFRLLDKRFTKRFFIALSSGIVITTVILVIGMFVTRSLIPLEGEIEPITNRYTVEKESQQEETLE